MDISKRDGDNPWLGLSTYMEGLKLYGRDTEISTLMDIVCNNLATVVFGRSGIGKSSLIHAGLFPEIRKQGLMPIYIRFEHNTESSYVQQIEKTITKYLEKEDRLGEKAPRMGLWDFFHRNVFYNKENQSTIPVIVIDQFEEIYTLADSNHKHFAQELFEELADLLNNKKPAKVMAYEDEAERFTMSNVEMDGDNVLTFRVHSEKRLEYIDESLFHIVICLREDYLYYLERNTSKIPSFKVNRFCLQALNRKSAENVIMLPKPGLFNSAEADDIVSKISTSNDEGKEEIDPTILSIFLFKYYNSEGNVRTDNVIAEFYADETLNISRKSLAYIEENLLTGEGFRHSVPYNDALSNGVTKQELDKLINSRILTVEIKKKHNYIEFSHDVLCPIAKEHRERRKIDEQTRKLRKRILAATGLSFFAIILIGSFLYLYRQVKEKDSSLTITQTINNSQRAHYMIIKGDVLNAIKLLLNIVPEVREGCTYNVLPETERVLNEAYDSLYSDYACIALLKHQDDVTAASYSEDSKFIVTASNDGICRIWDGVSGEKIQELKNNYKGIRSISLNREGKKVIESFDNGYILIWDIASGHIVKTLEGHMYSVNSAYFSPDDKFILSASDDHTVKLWDVKSGKCQKTLVEHKDKVNRAVFNKDGSKIITSSEDGSSILYDLNSQVSKVLFSKEECSVEYAEFSNDDKKIAIVTNNAVYVLNSRTGKTETVLNEHNGLVTSASFGPDGKTIATSSYDKTIKLWDIATGKVLHTYKGHSNVVKDVIFSPNGKFILSTSTDNEARIWNTEIHESPRIIPNKLGVLASITYSPDGNYIAAVSAMGEANIWETKTGNIISSFKTEEMANSINFNKKGDEVVVATNCGKIRIHNVASGHVKDSIQISEIENFDYALFAHDDKSIIAYSRENRTILYNLATRTYEFAIEFLTCLRLGNEQSICLASSCEKNSFFTWDLHRGEYLMEYAGHSKNICSVNYSHDFKKIVSGSDDNTAIIWNTETAQIVHKLKNHSSQIYFAEFSCDDCYVLTVSADGSIKIWNAFTGEEISTRQTSTTPIYTNMFCPNAPKYIIADGDDIRIHNLYTPKDLVIKFKGRYKMVKFTQEEKEYYSMK